MPNDVWILTTLVVISLISVFKDLKCHQNEAGDTFARCLDFVQLKCWSPLGHVLSISQSAAPLVDLLKSCSSCNWNTVGVALDGSKRSGITFSPSRRHWKTTRMCCAGDPVLLLLVFFFNFLTIPSLECELLKQSHCFCPDYKAQEFRQRCPTTSSHHYCWWSLCSGTFSLLQLYISTLLTSSLARWCSVVHANRNAQRKNPLSVISLVYL